MRFMTGIILLFALVIGVNFTMAYLALGGRDPVVATYSASGR